MNKKKIIDMIETIKHYINKDNISNAEILITELQQSIKEYKKQKK